MPEPTREQRLEAAIMRVYAAPFYEVRGKPETGISLAMIAAINAAAYLVETDEDCRHDFGMLGVCVECGADETDVRARIAAFKERQAKLILAEAASRDRMREALEQINDLDTRHGHVTEGLDEAGHIARKALAPLSCPTSEEEA